MDVVKVRRVGNTNVITLPRWLEAHGFEVGAQILIDEMPSGEVVLRPASALRDHIRRLAREVIAEDREALDILARA